MELGKNGGIALVSDHEIFESGEALNLLSPDPDSLTRSVADHLTEDAEAPFEIEIEYARLVVEGLKLTLAMPDLAETSRQELQKLLRDYEENIEHAEKTAVLDRVAEAGWAFAGGDTVVSGRIASTGINLIREKESPPLTPEAVIKRLNLTGAEEGVLLPGFEVALDEDTEQLYIDYSGAYDERFKEFLEDVITWGKQLNDEQAAVDSHNRLH